MPESGNFRKTRRGVSSAIAPNRLMEHPYLLLPLAWIYLQDPVVSPCLLPQPHTSHGVFYRLLSGSLHPSAVHSLPRSELYGAQPDLLYCIFLTYLVILPSSTGTYFYLCLLLCAIYSSTHKFFGKRGHPFFFGRPSVFLLLLFCVCKLFSNRGFSHNTGMILTSFSLQNGTLSDAITYMLICLKLYSFESFANTILARKRLTFH